MGFLERLFFFYYARYPCVCIHPLFVFTHVRHGWCSKLLYSSSFYGLQCFLALVFAFPFLSCTFLRSDAVMEEHRLSKNPTVLFHRRILDSWSKFCLYSIASFWRLCSPYTLCWSWMSRAAETVLLVHTAAEGRRSFEAWHEDTGIGKWCMEQRMNARIDSVDECVENKKRSKHFKRILCLFICDSSLPGKGYMHLPNINTRPWVKGGHARLHFATYHNTPLPLTLSHSSTFSFRFHFYSTSYPDI